MALRVRRRRARRRTGSTSSTAPAPGRNGADGVTTTGLDNVDFWIGGLAEEQMPFGGMLGSTFNFVFENQLEKLQDGDRFYYLERTAGLNFLTELENNSFAKLIMANTDATHLPGDVFSTPGFILEVDQTQQFTGLGADGSADPDRRQRCSRRWSSATTRRRRARIRTTCSTPATEHVVLGGTAGNDIIIASEGDDTLCGDGGNDRLEGGYGNDMHRRRRRRRHHHRHRRRRHHPGRATATTSSTAATAST